MFAQYYFVIPVLHNILNHFFALTLYHFTCLPILEGDITRITKYDYDKYFIISALVNSGGTCDAKAKEK